MPAIGFPARGATDKRIVKTQFTNNSRLAPSRRLLGRVPQPQMTTYRPNHAPGSFANRPAQHRALRGEGGSTCRFDAMDFTVLKN